MALVREIPSAHQRPWHNVQVNLSKYAYLHKYLEELEKEVIYSAPGQNTSCVDRSRLVQYVATAASDDLSSREG